MSIATSFVYRSNVALDPFTPVTPPTVIADAFHPIPGAQIVATNIKLHVELRSI